MVMEPQTFIHPSSIVDEGAQLGAGTQIWHFCHISKGARLGRNCRLGQNVYVGNHVVIGDGVKIQNNVSVYEGVTLEDGVFCGPSVVFTNVNQPRSEFPIDRHTGYQKTLVRKGATLGANGTVVCGHVVGSYAFVGAGAVVTRDVPDHALVHGNPARLKGWVCVCGERLRWQDDRGQCDRCLRRFIAQGEGKIVLLSGVQEIGKR